jgi:5,10-methylenetetrahydromethanopterin reductase
MSRDPSPSDVRTGVWFFPNQPSRDLIAAIEHAERAGIDEVWIGDEGPAREPMAILAAAAMTTTSIRLGIGITNPYVRHPAAAVASMATIAELAPGRVVLGVGAGGAMSLAPFELEAEHPVDAVARFLQIARAAARGEATDGYAPSDIAVAAMTPPVPVFVGARGPRLNELASAHADGAFVAGMAPFRYAEVIGWARSVRPIDIALYPSVAFGAAALERHRPEMIWSLLDSPTDVMTEFGLDPDAIADAASALRQGDRDPATTLIDDRLLDRLMLSGSPAGVGGRLGELVAEHRPTSIGLAIVADDLIGSIERATEAFSIMRSVPADSEPADETDRTGGSWSE